MTQSLIKYNREMAHATFNGGHHDEPAHSAFHHGMDTVFNLIDAGAIQLPDALLRLSETPMPNPRQPLTLENDQGAGLAAAPTIPDVAASVPASDFNRITKQIQAEAGRYLAHLNSAKPLNEEFRIIKGRIVTLACQLLASGNTVESWRPIETCPLCTEALFMGRIWRHPYWGIKNGDGGSVWIDGVGDANWQAYDAAWWMPLAVPQRAPEVSSTTAASSAQKEN